MVTADLNSETISIRVHTTHEAISAIAKDWDRLSGGVPFRSWTWHHAWLNHYCDAITPYVITVHDNTQDQCIGIAPLFIDQHGVLGQTIRFIGSGIVCSDYQTILAEAENSQVVGRAIAGWLVDQCQGSSGLAGTGIDCFKYNALHWEMLILDGVDTECPTMQSFLNTLKDYDFITHKQSNISTWKVSLPEKMEDYVKRLSKSSRRKVRTAQKRFASGEAVIHIAENEEEFKQTWCELVKLHKQRRISNGKQGSFFDDNFIAFLFEAASQFHSARMLDLISVSVGGKTIAAEICFRGTPVTYAYQIGIDPDSLRLNPGWLVNVASIEHAISIGQRGFDLCRGDSEYKKHLGADPTESVEYRLVPPMIRSQIWDAAIVTKSLIKDWCKSSLEFMGKQ